MSDASSISIVFALETFYLMRSSEASRYRRRKEYKHENIKQIAVRPHGGMESVEFCFAHLWRNFPREVGSFKVQAF